VATRIGVDVGGSGIKAGVVDIEAGKLVSDRLRVDTPEPSTPPAVVAVVRELVDRLDEPGTVGIGFPTVIRHGVIYTANNIDRSWIGVNALGMFEDAIGREVRLINDADAAGLAECRYGAARGVSGVVLVLTFGTGIGSALFLDGRLIPNTEAGQLELNGARPAEAKYSAKARRRENLSWDQWGERAREFITLVYEVLNPDLIVIGGGVSKFWDQFASHVTFDEVPTTPAALANNAGIIGAAAVAFDD
jgi:polyphosphate glucokinase